MKEKTLNFDGIEISKEKIHASKQPIDLILVMATSFEHGEKTLNILLTMQMAIQLDRYVLQRFCRNTSFLVKNDSILIKHNEIWHRNERLISKKLHKIMCYNFICYV